MGTQCGEDELGLEGAGTVQPSTGSTEVGTAPSIGTAFTAPLLSAQDEALSEAFGCWHFPGMLFLTMTRAPTSMEARACWGPRRGLIPPCPPTRDLGVHPGPHADPMDASCLSLRDWERMQNQMPLPFSPLCFLPRQRGQTKPLASGETCAHPSSSSLFLLLIILQCLVTCCPAG